MMPAGLERIKNARILVVEDSIANQTLARDLLLHAGAHVDLAGNGREAIRAIKDAGQPYDIVLMDLQMPIMDGLEATGIIRGELGYDSLPIIATTANTERKEHIMCLDAGANDCLPKPFHIHELYAVLIRWLKPAEAAHTPGETPGADVDVPSGAGDVTLPGAIAGVDMEVGLSRVGGKRELFASLLVDFADEHDEFARAFDDAAEAGDRDRIRFLVHGIRSTAGNIGADALSGAAGQIERMVASGDDGLEEHLSRFRTAQDELVAAIRSAGIVVRHDREHHGETRGDFDGDETGRLIAKLQDMLEDQDLGAEDEFARLAEMLDGRGHDAVLSEIEENIEALQYSSARQILWRVGKDLVK